MLVADSRPSTDVSLQITLHNEFAEIVNLDISRANITRRVDEADGPRAFACDSLRLGPRPLIPSPRPLNPGPQTLPPGPLLPCIF